MKLLVLSGGFGTRLKNSIGDLPKSLAPVNGVPFLYLQLIHWRSQGLTDFVFLLHHQAEQIIAFIESERLGLLQGCSVNWVVELFPLGTGGAIANAVRTLELKGDFLAANADTWLGTGVSALLDTPSPTIAVVKMTDTSRYGSVQFNSLHMVSKFVEKNALQGSGWINAGFFRLDAGLFTAWDSKPFSLEKQLFEPLIKNQTLSALPLQTDFLDIGVPDDYSRFCRWAEADYKSNLWN